MIAQENKYINITGAFPNGILIDASGPGLTDGSELVALNQNDGWESFQQALMDYLGGGGTNAPTGTPGTPNGVSDAAGISQIVEALHMAFGIGPGTLKISMKDDDPSVTGDRVLLLQGQGVLIATYPDLDAATWVGDAGGTHNAAVHAGGGKFYRSSDSGGATPNPAGPYLQLPESRGYAMRVLDILASVDPLGASRFLGDNQVDAMQKLTGEWSRTSTTGAMVASSVVSGVFKIGAASFATGTSPAAATARSVGFDSSLSTSPNTAKTDDVETRMANLSIKLGITY